MHAHLELEGGNEKIEVIIHNLKKRKLKIVARLEKELGVSRINHEPIESSYTSTKQNKTKNKTCRVSPMKKWKMESSRSAAGGWKQGNSNKNLIFLISGFQDKHFSSPYLYNCGNGFDIFSFKLWLHL